MALERENETYNRNLASLLPSEGKFVLVQGDDIVDIYGTYEDAIKAAYAKFGVDKPFLVRQIQAVQPVQYVTRAIIPCHT